MRRNGNIVSYTSDEVDEMIARGETKTDWTKVNSITEEELQRLIAEDDDEAPLAPGWDDVMLIQKGTERSGRVTLSADIVEWFMFNGPQARLGIEAVLRRHIEQQTALQQAKESADVG